MNQLEGYRITETLYEGVATIIFRGLRVHDKTPIVIKTLRSEYPALEEIARLRHEYRILTLLTNPGVIKTLALEKQNNRLSLVLEDFGGESLRELLKKRQLDIPEFLKIAINLTSALEVVHQHHVIHKDIKPSNIVVNLDTDEVKIIDFGLSTLLSNENQTVYNPNKLEGSLAYISPEQTGRMNRSIDYRTDFYSLGVTFYELLIGSLPFQTNDPMELVHCHIAKQPTPPHELNPDVPPVLSDLVMKLMAKTAEERYQTSFGLRSDLEACQLLKGRLINFEVGQQDRSGQFHIPQKLYGREQEVQSLLNAFDRVSQSRSEMMLIAGYSGIGKSSLVHEIHKPVTRQRGFFISGKFDQFQRDIPFFAIIQAFRELIRRLLSGSDIDIMDWREKLIEALGNNGQVIVDVIPEIEFIIGRQPSISQLGPTESRNRFNLVFQQFIQVFTQPEHPLVLFLDDLQWADSASLGFIQLLMTDPESRYLLLLGAYRDNEVSQSHPLILVLDELARVSGAVPIQTITVKSLETEHINQLIQETLTCSREQSKPLADLCLQKTNGNPFFLNQLLKSLYIDKMLWFDTYKGKWVWDIEQISSQSITENVIDLMISKIKKLNEEAQVVIQLAACVGNQFSLEILSIIYEKSQPQTAADLWDALKEGFILPLDDSYKIPMALQQEADQYAEGNDVTVSYRFLHDRVQQAAYTLIPDSERQETHLKIGQLLLQHIPKSELEESLFDVVNHLNQGAVLVTDPVFRHDIALLNQLAGNKAKVSTAYEPALRYFTAATSFLTQDSWADNYDLTFSLYRERAECEYLCSNLGSAEDLFDQIINHTDSYLDKVEIQILRLALYDSAGKYLENLQIGSSTLADLGIRVPLELPEIIDEFNRELSLYKESLGGINISSLINAPTMTDIEIKASMQILMNMTGPAYFTNQDLLALTSLKMTNLSIEYGSTDVSAHGYAFWGTVSGARLGEYEVGYEFGRLAMNLLEKYPNPKIQCKVYNLFGALISPWRSHLSESIPILRKGYQVGVETGDVYTSYNSYNLIMQRLIAAEDPVSIIEESNKHLDWMKRTKNYVFAGVQELDQHFLMNLQGLTLSGESLSDEGFSEVDCLQMFQENKFFPGVATYNIFKLQVLYLVGNYREALEYARESESTVVFVSGIPNTADYHFFYSLTLTALYSETDEIESKLSLEKIQTNQSKMKLWADNCRENYEHKYLLVEAEYARITNQFEQAVKLYDLGIESAQKYDYVQNTAIANELAAKFWLERKYEKIAKVYMSEAHYNYRLWGAMRKVLNLEEHYPDLLPAEAPSQLLQQSTTYTISQQTVTGTYSEGLDLATVVRSLQTLTSEMLLDQLLKTLMEIVVTNAGAQRGFLILQEEGELRLEAERTINEEVKLLDSQPLTKVNRQREKDLTLSVAIINYVARTHESIVLNDATNEGNFIRDPYIVQTRPKSVLCTPLIKQGLLSGILYLENNLTTNAFTPERVEFSQLLSAQAAISIESCHLYEKLEEYSKTLEQKVEERTIELQHTNESLEQTLTELRATQQELLQAEKMAALGQLVAGVAHEVNTPLGCAITAISMLSETSTEICKSIDKGKIKRSTLVEGMGTIQQGSEIVLSNLQRATDLVQSFKQVAVDQSIWDKRLFNIHDYLHTLIITLEPQLIEGRHRVEIKGKSTLEVESYPGALSQVITNLVMNSATHAYPNRQYGCITIEVAQNEDRLNLQYKDDGCGIPQAYLARIYEPFFTTTRHKGGTGLGLHIVYNLVTQTLQGRIQCNSTEGQGTQFIIDLPISL